MTVAWCVACHMYGLSHVYQLLHKPHQIELRNIALLHAFGLSYRTDLSLLLAPWLLGLAVDSSMGGLDLSTADACMVCEGLAMGDSGLATYLALHNMAAWLVDK